MDDPQGTSSEPAENRNALPDVVHSQQIPTLDVVNAETESSQAVAGDGLISGNPLHYAQETSETESISEHLPSKVEDSLSETDNITKSHESKVLLQVDTGQENVSKSSSPNIPLTHSPTSENPSSHDPAKQSSSWPIDGNAASDTHISKESPVNLAVSSDFSKEMLSKENESQSLPQSALLSEHKSEESHVSDNYVDSLNNESYDKSLEMDGDGQSLPLSGSGNKDSQGSLGSDEIIKLDIRGQGVPKFPISTAKIIFGPPPQGGTILDSNTEPIPVFQNLISPFLVSGGDTLNVEEVFDFSEPQFRDPSLDKSLEMDKSIEISLDKSSSDKSEQDLLVEEITIEDGKEKIEDKPDETSLSQPKSMAPEETMSFSTMTTDYKTICEEYHTKLVNFEDALTQRDERIKELTISLQLSVRERDELRLENEHLSGEVQHLQHVVGERSPSDHDTVKAQLSDFMKYQSMVKDDSTRFYSALMSGGSSLPSSNGEKDMDNEEITVNYSKSDLRSSSSEDFQTGFEIKVSSIINKFDEHIEENLRNKLRESIIQVLCDEIGKMRIDWDTEIKELESQMQQDKQTYTMEARRLRELLASVKAGNADIDALREELSIKHEKEMENLRTYFEKKCTDMERSYSEEVWRGKTCGSPGGSASSLEAPDAAGDYIRRRTRSAELPSLSLESTTLEQAVKQVCKKYEQQLEELRADHVAYVSDVQARHAETIAAMDEQITQLKAHIQTAENTEANVSLYQQDIDLELEKDERFMKRVEQIRQEVTEQLQEQIQVLLSDPDAEVSSWPVELVALRDKIHGDKLQEKELSSLRDELSGSEDKWRHRRNVSFDQNRHLEEVTKERDGLRRVAVSLHRAVGQLVAYCACAEDELNRTVLAQLLPTLVKDKSFTLETSLDTSDTPVDLDISALSQTKRVHFAPDLKTVLADLDEDGVLAFLQQQRDLSADIKADLELSLKRLRQEAHDLLELSSRLTNKHYESKMLESSQLQITELAEEEDEGDKQNCDNCELHRKSMEEAVREGLQRESLLRGELAAALLRLAQFADTQGNVCDADVIAEGYGTGQESEVRPRRVGSVSLGPQPSPRRAAQLDALQRERDDALQQLEAANRQLRSTRQFVDEQANERELERDEFARRLADLRDDNARLTTRLQNNARILSEMHRLRPACVCHKNRLQVEQLEAQTREMNQLILDLESRKASTDEDLKSKEEKITILRDIIANLESQLEQKSSHEVEVLGELENMRKIIDERDGRMRSLLGELESLRSERAEQSDVTCVKCAQEEEKCCELLDRIKEQCEWVEERIYERTERLERSHEQSSAPCSEPSEDVSLRNRRQEIKSPSSPPTPRNERLSELLGVWDALQGLSRACDAALKRVRDLEMQRAQLHDVAQYLRKYFGMGLPDLTEVRAERDVLQARMSEQALKISSLSARLQAQRTDADALAHHAHAQLSVQLHDTRAEVQKLKEDLESKDKQLLRLKQSLEEKDKKDYSPPLYGNSCNPKDKVVILERELSSAQTRIAQLESLARSLETDKDDLQIALRDHQRALAEKEEQLQELLALKLDDDQEKSEVEGKVSARTLSDIVSISEFDEQDLQMRRAELRALDASLPRGARTHTDKHTHTLNRTLPPELQRPHMSSLDIEYADSDVPHPSPRADSLPAHLTSTQNTHKQYKRNVNETTLFSLDKFGEGVKHSTAQKIPDNCSMYPNRDVSDNKHVTVEPKVINFSMEPTEDNRTRDDEYASLRELGINLDLRQENFPDILRQLKHEISKSRTELENCKSELKNAEEQLCEFPALKEEVEELKSLLENTMATMATDKKFYENQLDIFSSNKKLLEQRMAELTQEVNDKTKELLLLKEDILRRENMILELAKEKRNLTNKMTELEVKIDELQSRNNVLENCESENRQMREKMSELEKLQQLVSEKNQQIDSLNQHLDRLDDLQRRLNDKTEELDNIKETYEEKSNELFQMQDAVEALNRDIARLTAENIEANSENRELKLQLSKMEKEQENTSLKLQNSEGELERLNSLNTELTSKIDELKLMTDKLKDKETEIEILHEDINSFHDEVASLKEQLKMVSRSPSPKNKSIEEKRITERPAGADMKQLVKIRKQVSLLQHELDFNKKELNDKAFELAKAKLDVTELKNSVGQSNKLVADQDLAIADLRQQVQQLQAERQQSSEQLAAVNARLREECNVSELRSKLHERVRRCQELEAELQDMRDLVDRIREPSLEVSSSRALVLSAGAGAGAGAGGGGSGRGLRSPTAELERALRDQLHYSSALDDRIMDQILSASSDEREDIPRLALNTSKSSSSLASSSSEKMQRLRAENEKLQMQVTNLDLRIRDKDALIAELNRIREQLQSESQARQLRYEAERDNAARLQLLLRTHKETADSLQNQDSHMIQMLKKRLESAMQSEVELQQQLAEMRSRANRLERRGPEDDQLRVEENTERLRGEISVLKSKLEVERVKASDAAAALDTARVRAARDLQHARDAGAALRGELADAKRLQHEAGVELVRTRELAAARAAALAALQAHHAHARKGQTEIETQKSDLAREMAALKKCLTEMHSPQVEALKLERDRLSATLLQSQASDRDQAVRYLQARCVRLESWRKALVWQKRYLQRALAGYAALERRLPPAPRPPPPSPLQRFRRAVVTVCAALRMQFLVRRRHHARAAAARCLLRHDTSASQHDTSYASRGPLGGGAAPRGRGSAAPPAPPSPSSPTYGDFLRRPISVNSPRDEPFVLSSPCGEAGAYLGKLELAGRCVRAERP